MSITGPAPVTYDSDLSGNTILENNRVYGYDVLNRLSTVTDNVTQIASYAYNAMNQRVRKITTAGTKIFHYDLNGHLIAETNGTGQTLVEYIYLGDQLLAMIRPTEQVYYYHNDHLGTPRVMTNSTGNVAWKARYTPFGAATITTGTVENNIRFPGQYFDIETGLHYNWNRYYDPKIGRYITPDPIGLAGGINLFSYVGNDPVNWIDPWGLWDVRTHDQNGLNRGTQKVDDDPRTNPERYPHRSIHFASEYGGSFIAMRESAKCCMQIAVSKREYNRCLHTWEDSFNPAHNSYFGHALEWIFMTIKGGGDSNNPDSPVGPYRAQHDQMEKARAGLPPDRRPGLPPY